MIIEHGQLWICPKLPGMIVVTTNSIVKSDGLLVMGRGSAGDATKYIRGIREEVTRKIKLLYPYMPLNGTGVYGFIEVRPAALTKCGFGIFQAKKHWRDVSELGTLRKSTAMLAYYANNNPDVSIRMPMPGWGCGQIGQGSPLSREQIMTIMSALPNNVTCVIRHGEQF